MSLESQQRGLFIVVSRKRGRSPSSRSEESLLLAPKTPPATARRRIFDDEEEEDSGVTTQEWEHNYVSEIEEPHKKSGIRPWWTQDDALVLTYQDDLDDHASPNFPEESSSHLPFAMSTFDLSAEESYIIASQSQTKSGLFSLSREDIDDIANAAVAAVTALPSTPRPADHRPIVAQPAPTVEALQSSHPDEESSSFSGKSTHDHSSGEENHVGSST